MLVSKCKCVSLKYQLANLAAQEINFKGCALTASALFNYDYSFLLRCPPKFVLKHHNQMRHVPGERRTPVRDPTPRWIVPAPRQAGKRHIERAEPEVSDQAAAD